MKMNSVEVYASGTRMVCIAQDGDDGIHHSIEMNPEQVELVTNWLLACADLLKSPREAEF